MAAARTAFRSLLSHAPIASSSSSSASRIASTSRLLSSSRYYSSTPTPEPTAETAKEASPAAGDAPPAAGAATKSEAELKVAELTELLEKKDKILAELKDARLRTLADFENLQKISTREKALAKDFALTSFAKDLVQSIDILSLALKSVPADKTTSTEASNGDLVNLFTGVQMTKAELEKCLKRHGVVAFDPVGEAFDPERHEALYQAPVPGKEPGTVLEVQEIGYMIKDRLLRPAKVGVVLAQD